jgi:hypothetical protein
LPAVKDAEWCLNGIDRFVLARLENKGMSPSPRAEKARLIRRAYLTLIGLPPTVEEVDAFLADGAADAYEKVVDRLLASKHYGERWAIPWLDLARCADSNGFQRDGHREVWAYRDWVIRAINADMPFDQFTIEQIAGDLLPNATQDQKVATGFHRGTTVNVEAGVDQEENRVNQIVDRVNVTGTVWLGTTLECVQCHEHKYDPFSMEDYYGLFAYFNNTVIETSFRTEKSTAELDFVGPTMALALPPVLAREFEARKERLERRHARAQRTLDEYLSGPESAYAKWERETTGIVGRESEGQSVPEEIAKILQTAAGERSKSQNNQLRAHFVQEHADVRDARDRVTNLKEKLDETGPATSLTMVERDEPRMTRVFNRGNFLTPGEAVQPGTPMALHPLREGSAGNRLELAEWLVDPANPLIGRVTVNRWWAEFFGRGLVTTPEDFGTQGELPTHPGLLDWLAVEFVEAGWSAKHIHKLIAMSATFQQSSKVDNGSLQRDPYNALYGRGPRLRLKAELIRDNGLAVSGLLNPRIGGPLAYPPQPDGIWRVVGKVDNTYPTSEGEDRYRRGVYTVWRRSAPYPSFVNFDAPDRASCVVKRVTTNTPLQALTLMNDPTYQEMAVSLAVRIARAEPGGTVGDRVIRGFRMCLARAPSAKEMGFLETAYRGELARVQSDEDGLQRLSETWEIPANVSRAELAAWTYVATILLNLDETITSG